MMYKTIAVVDDDSIELDCPGLEVISFEAYLNDYPKLDEPKTRIINLCDTEHYLSRGYYCSLLAEARQHRVLPSVATINELRHWRDHARAADRVLNPPLALLQRAAESEHDEQLVFFGWAGDGLWQGLASFVFDKFPAPILSMGLHRDKAGPHLRVERCGFSQLDEAGQAQFLERLAVFIQQVWRSPTVKRRLRWDMAILVDPDEPFPPSNAGAIKRFIAAAAKVGIHAETITAAQSEQVMQFDALFIRETTAIDHHTYQIARRAEQKGLVVIDDPQSILRCCNKVYLHDAFSYQGVPAPRTRIIGSASAATIDDIEAGFGYPLVLKLPEGSFSRGVYRVQDRRELAEKAAELLSDTTLLLVQEYLYTDFDWRVGVLGGRAIYACRYHMARNHWQIYNHKAKRYSSGGFETLPTFEVPRPVLDAATKAAAVAGDGLYGVDVKQRNSDVYVIEVNDNPSIDHGVEDQYLGKELYLLIMREFAERLEARGRRP
jgi:glutathione synthase/RimK-type ligase-like ATP-grasp enzyme